MLQGAIMETAERITQTPLSKKVDEMLDEWAIWSRTGVNPGIGFPRMSSIAWLIENGGIVARTTGPKYLPENKEAEEMNTWISQLNQEKPIEAQALIAYYLSGMIKETLAKKLKITPRMLNMRIRIAKIWLEGRFSSKYY